MDRIMELSEYMVRRIKEQPDKFYLILEPEMVNVSFWYLPKQLRGLPHDHNKEIRLGKVSTFTSKVFLPRIPYNQPPEKGVIGLTLT